MEVSAVHVAAAHGKINSGDFVRRHGAGGPLGPPIALGKQQPDKTAGVALQTFCAGLEEHRWQRAAGSSSFLLFPLVRCNSRPAYS